MNIYKNKLIRKGFGFSKVIIPAVGGILLIMKSGYGRFYGALVGFRAVPTQKVNATPSKDTLNKNGRVYYSVYANTIKSYFDKSDKPISVCSEATKLVILIQELANCGEPAVYPSTDPKSGEPILDYNGQPIGYRGFVFVNPIDNCYQVVKGDGSGIIIINQLTEKQVVKISDKVRELETLDPLRNSSN